jgi:hypothetical protein
MAPLKPVSDDVIREKSAVVDKSRGSHGVTLSRSTLVRSTIFHVGVEKEQQKNASFEIGGAKSGLFLCLMLNINFK